MKLNLACPSPKPEVGSTLRRDVVDEVARLGSTLIGFAPASRWADAGEVAADYRPDAIWRLAKTVIVVGVPMLLPIVESTPSINYQEMYNASNVLLDQIAFRLALFLNGRGFPAIPISRDGYGNLEILLKKMPASFSHVYAGKYAGVGTIGFSHNLINPQFGPRVRYVSVFTAAEIEGDPVIEKDLCKKCELCRRLCPVQALAASPGRLEANRGPGGLIHPASTQSAAPEQVYLQRGLPNSIGGSVVIGATHFGTTADGLVAADWATGKVLWQEASAGGPLPSLSAPARQPNPLLPRT
jgi:ferredoxin